LVVIVAAGLLFVGTSTGHVAEFLAVEASAFLEQSLLFFV
jgi:hypothetical protein